ncbi:MAG: nucleotidyltransferase domain-containing protein [Candidatus Omnitrophota bacterium]
MRFYITLSDLFKSEVKLKVIKFLLDHEALMSEREIASILKISHMSVNRTLRDLNEFNLVGYSTVGKSHLWKVNRQSYAYTMLKELMKQVKSIEDPLQTLKQTITKRLLLKSVQRMVLFGSIAQKTERADSDIDLFILIKNNQEKARLEAALDKLSLECLERFGNRLSPYLLTDKELHQKKGLEIIAAVNRGIQLYPLLKDKS